MIIQLPNLNNKSALILRVLIQNFGWAFIFNLLALPYAASGLLHPILGALGMVASSLIVVGHSLRLKRILENP